LLEELLKGAHV